MSDTLFTSPQFLSQNSPEQSLKLVSMCFHDILLALFYSFSIVMPSLTTPLALSASKNGSQLHVLEKQVMPAFSKHPSILSGRLPSNRTSTSRHRGLNILLAVIPCRFKVTLKALLNFRVLIGLGYPGFKSMLFANLSMPL